MSLAMPVRVDGDSMVYILNGMTNVPTVVCSWQFLLKLSQPPFSVVIKARGCFISILISQFKYFFYDKKTISPFM